ncbi:MAG: radical S-adenosyl methionine domain-containing protein 1 [Benjaminiella poitrasii]|nr:MAG: radical S-adenosyl methionine domain-containing protein 1 [Benjaminiella poitrasii]
MLKTLQRKILRNKILSIQKRAFSLNESFSIYVHWPFCESKCTYCNFNKYVHPKNDPPHDRLVQAMMAELKYYLKHPYYQLKNKRVNSVYFGGGTPSLAKPKAIESLLCIIDRYVGLEEGAEISMEANPTSVEQAKLVEFKEAGINRLSLGIQSFYDEDLKILGRDHSGKEAFKAITLANNIFNNKRVSFDLIYARPGQTVVGWEKELRQALDIAGDHLSLYQLTLERSTPLHKQSLKGLLPTIPDSDTAADMYEETLKIMKEYDYHHYEVSNYAKSQQAISRHNFSYWQGMDYLGIGPGAHGRLTDSRNGRRVRTFGEFHPDKYMALCEAEGEGIRKLAPISINDVAEELIVFGMRTRMGIPRSRFSTFTNGKILDEVLDEKALDLFIRSGLLINESKVVDNDLLNYVPEELVMEWSDQGGIRPTELGLEKIDYILPRLLKSKQ